MRLTVDTNVLIYAIDSRFPERRLASNEILAALVRCDSIITLQALAEFLNATVRKGITSPAFASAQVRRWLGLFPPPVLASVTALEIAIRARDERRFAFFDALLVASAGTAGCDVVLSEDMGHGAALDRVRVVGAFDAQGGVSPAARAALGMA